MQYIIKICVLALATLLTQVAMAEDSPVKPFLRYVYGAEGIDISKVCLPSDDIWMLRGAKDENALASVDALMFETNRVSGVFCGMVGKDGYFVEVRGGKVDPAFSLEAQFQLHRQLVKMFVYGCLCHNQRTLDRITTDAKKVEISGPKEAPPAGDMDVYEGVIGALPVVRTSKSSEDMKSKTVTYRVPVGEAGLSLTLAKKEGTWKVDTSKPVKVSLSFFYQ
ncbi:MAG: hypothetical protein C5B50_10025 [Verrucomicrobia bacterium]|nr:MAG: hypothetical protein C5B50_10025 [Verrucomicrobiota bacterium]